MSKGQSAGMSHQIQFVSNIWKIVGIGQQSNFMGSNGMTLSFNQGKIMSFI